MISEKDRCMNLLHDIMTKRIMVKTWRTLVALPVAFDTIMRVAQESFLPAYYIAISYLRHYRQACHFHARALSPKSPPMSPRAHCSRAPGEERDRASISVGQFKENTVSPAMPSHKSKEALFRCRRRPPLPPEDARPRAARFVIAAPVAPLLIIFTGR